MQVYILKNNQQLGPFEETKVLEMLRNGQLSPNDLGIRQGQTQWQTLKMLFPNIFPVWSPPQTPVTYQTPSIPNKGGSSKGLLFALLGVIVFFSLGVVGIAGVFIFAGKSNTVANANIVKPTNEGNSANTNSNKSKTNSGEPKFVVMKNKAEELAKMSPPLKLDPNAAVKGKVAVVVKDNREAEVKGFDPYFKEYTVLSRDVYGIAKRRLAVTPDEIDTLIQILCSKGKHIGNYEGGIKGYANVCKVSIIDYRNPAVIAQGSFTNDRPDNSVSSVYEDSREYITLKPDNLIGEFINKFPLEKLANPTTDIPFNDKDGKYGKYTPFKEIAAELGRVAMPVNLDSNAALKGKVTIIQVNPEGEAELKGFDVYGKEFYSYEIDRFGLTNDKMAENEQEIETIVRINCKKGNLLKTVSRTGVYSNQCEVSIIDYKASTIIAQKMFENKEVIGEVDTDVYKIQYIVLPPSSQIEQYVKGFPKS